MTQQTHYGWMIQGSSQAWFGEYAELDAKAEAMRCGGTCAAFAIYIEPPIKQPLSTERTEAIARLFECLRITTLTTREATAIKDAADMLEADTQQVAVPAKREPLSVDKARLDWLDQNMFNRENLDLFGKLDQTYNMWVMFSPKGVQGAARAIIDAAIAAQKPQGDNK